MLSDLIKLVSDNIISSKQAKEVLYESLTEGKVPTDLVKEKGLKQIGGKDEILSVVTEVLSEHPDAIDDYKNGHTNIVDYLVGQVMKKTKGEANPSMARSMMIEEINKR